MGSVVQNSGWRVEGWRVESSIFRVQDLGFRVWSLGFWDERLRFEVTLLESWSLSNTAFELKIPMCICLRSREKRSHGMGSLCMGRGFILFFFSTNVGF